MARTLPGALLAIESPLSIGGAAVVPLPLAPQSPTVGAAVAAVGHPNAAVGPVTEGPGARAVAPRLGVGFRF